MRQMVSRSGILLKRHKNNMVSTYFKKYISIAPFTLAIWRSYEAEALSEHIHFKRPILDLGCGFGEFSGVFFQRQIETGVDISQKDVELAQGGKKYKKLIVADARKLPFRKGSFETIMSLSVLEHIPQVDGALRESYRILRLGGRLVFTVPTRDLNQYLVYPSLLNKLGLTKIADWYIDTFHTVFKHVNVWTPQKWISELKKAGFSKVTMKGTTPQSVITAFDLLLLTGLPSQILRWLFGKRFILGGNFRNVFFEWIFAFLTKDTKLTRGNILIIAEKK